MKLVSLKMDPAEAKEEAGCAPSCDPPLYPYGTSLYLDETEQKKLGILEMPAVGTEFPLEAVVTVIGTSERQTQDGTRKTLDLQITKMGLGIQGESAMDRAAKKLYPSG